MPSLVPADSLIYLETNDLGAVVGPILKHDAFQSVKGKPDTSFLDGIQLAVTVSGFELNEEELTGEHSIARIQPTFVAVVNTHAWNWQAVAFADQKIGNFVMDVYRSDVRQERSDKYGGDFFTWTSSDGRKAHALVAGGLVYFSNNEPALEKCLSVARGESESLAVSSKVPPSKADVFSSGYISPEGVSQLANVVGILSAAEIGDAPEVQSVIAGILPQLLRGGVKEIHWTSGRPTDREGGRIEDKYSITCPEEISRVLAETLASSGVEDRALFDIVSADTPDVAYYDLAKPNVAWRGLLLTAQSLADPSAGGLIAEFSNTFTEPYGIRDPELYLSGVSPAILTGNTDPLEEKPFVISTVTLAENVRRSLDPVLKPDVQLSSEFGVEVLRAEGEGLAAAFFDGRVLSGHEDSVIACLRVRVSGNSFGKNPAIADLLLTGGAASSLNVDNEIGPAIASSIFGPESAGKVQFSSPYSTKTRFTRTGIERRTVSDFGLIGSILANLNEEK